MFDLMRDVRHAARRLARTPMFTLATLLTLALGIGANAAIFSIVNAVMLRPLPFADPAALVHVRGFDTHEDRAGIMNNDGQTDQLTMLRRDLWNPLKVFVNKLKTTQFGTSGKSYWDLTTIVLASEMGRTIQGDVASIHASTDPDAATITIPFFRASVEIMQRSFEMSSRAS